MKTITPLILVLLFAAQAVSAQKMVHICGTEPVTLRTGNYQYGTIQWERSEDNINWESIPGAKDTTYTFTPERNMYYRAANHFSMCPPEHSETAHVTMPPKAHAGIDRIVPGNSVSLMANTILGAEGSWRILEGTVGSLSDINDPYAIFQGADSLYFLTWTLTNQCGSSTDTMQIQFRENRYIKQLAIVDDTDQIISDSLQMEGGLYIIRFSDPAPEITDSTILVGITHGGFLRKVESFTMENGTYTIHTSQASLEDVVIEGAIDLGAAFDIDTIITTEKNHRHYQRLPSMPTRKELTTDPRFKKGQYVYFISESPVYVHPGVVFEKRGKDDDRRLEVNFNSVLLEQYGFKLELNGYFKLTPNFVSDLDFERLNLQYFKLGMSNAIAERNIELKVSATLAELMSLKKEFTLFKFEKDIIFIVGGFPIWVTAGVSFKGEASAKIDASMELSQGFTKTTHFNAYVEYADNNWGQDFSESSTTATNSALQLTGGLEQHFEIGPSISVTVFRVVGPYADLRLEQDFDLCTDFNFWQTNMTIGGSFTLGAKAKIASWTMIDVNRKWSQGFYHYQFPHRLEIVSGNNQTYFQGYPLDQPVKVRVRSNRNLTLPFARVRFEPISGGSVSQGMVTATTGGYAETTWTPGGLEESSLRVVATDCKGNHLSTSPLLFKAYASTSPIECLESSLAVSVVETGNTISPQAHLGVPPYTYSTDDVNYSSQIPVVTPVMGETTLFYVKDDQECVASGSWSEQSDACRYTDLSLDLQSAGSTIAASAKGGTPTYTFSLNELIGDYSQNHIFVNVPVGRHVIYVKDAMGCIRARSTEIFQEQHPNCGVIVDLRDNNLYRTVQIGDQCWMAENLRFLPEVTGPRDQWVSETEPKYAVYGYESPANSVSEARSLENFQHYGVLYNWPAAMAGASSSDSVPSGIQGACPAGWHIPSEAEWLQLLDFLDIQGYPNLNLGNGAGNALKSCRQEGSPLGNGCNTTDQPRWASSRFHHGFDEFGFSVLPAGRRITDSALFQSLIYSSNMWTSTESSATNARRIGIYYSSGSVVRDQAPKRTGYSVRCVKD